MLFNRTTLLYTIFYFFQSYIQAQCCSNGVNLLANYNPDFSAPYTTTPPGFTNSNTYSVTLGPGYYSIITSRNYGACASTPEFDHTSGNTSGKFLWFDTPNWASAGNPAIAWKPFNPLLPPGSQDLLTVVPNTTYVFSCWIRDLARNPDCVSGGAPIMGLRINGTDMAQVNLATPVPGQCCPEWVYMCASWNSGNSTTALIQIESRTGSGFTDLGIDDVYFGSTAFGANINLGNDTTICTGQSLTLQANLPNSTNVWSDGSTGNTLTVSTSGLYWVEVTQNGCISRDSIVVNVVNCSNPISGIINTYTAVTDINPCTNTITVGNPSGFNAGSRVLVIQMKGAAIDTSNTTSFGNIINYNNAGNYEFGYIQSINGNQITLQNMLQRNYSVSGIVQLVHVPQYSGNVFVANNAITCQPWNGTTGGIIALEASGLVVLQADIDASNKGFRAGVANDNSPYICGQQDYFYPSNSSFGGRKGEGIFELPNTIINGRGKNTNGGGGGNDTNSGGAGGGNFGTGGRGGNQWTGCANLPIGGDGGTNLTYSNTANKIFLGGGAGGGHQNDATATPGTNGGGIIIIQCNGIAANGGGIKSFANNAVQASTDGSGGAGAGGTVLLQTNNITGNLTIDVHGGRGGDNTSHGTGGGGGGGIVWSTTTLPGNVVLNLAGGQPGFHSGTNGNHGATAGNNGGAISGLTFIESTIPFTPLVKPVATATSNVCVGDSILLSVDTVPNVVYSWVGTNNFSASQQHSNVPNATNAATGIYIATITDTLGCVQHDTVTVTVLNSSTSTINASICSKDQYTRPNGVSTNIPGTYTDTLTAANGCDSIITTNLSFLPNAFATVDTAICPNANFTRPTGLVVNTPGTYTDTLTATNGCDSIITTNLSFLPNAFATVDTAICTNANFTRPTGLVVNTPGTYTDTLTAANGCDSIITTNLSFHPTYTQIINDTICSGGTYILPDGNNVSQGGSYPITLTSTNGCDSLITINLTAVALTATTTTQAANCFGESSGSITIAANNGTAPYTYVLDSTASQTAATASVFNHLPAGNYFLEITDSNNCTATTFATISEPSPIIVNYTATDVSCFGNSDGSVQITASGGTPGYRFLLNGITNTGGYFSNLSSGNFNATVTDTNQCAAMLPLSISEPSDILITATPNPLVLKQGGKDSIHLSSNYGNNITYQWNSASGISCSNCSSVLVSAFNSTTYHVAAQVIINGNTCTAQIPVEVIVEPDYSIYIPNLFSPNSDGVNDHFEWFGNKQAVKIFEIQIFNRWGEKIFESNNKNFVWDGYYNGKEAAAGTYVYLLKITWIDGVRSNRYKGSFTLVK
ncbi:MAG: gliding motility-associated C-terminal domain-containing protein [Chitinophagales bacterium]|nr:gliding motility-associated C-terminal domain-containing protein [Chitinophagales bacterium]